jgi:hypothetical protein
VRQRNNILLLRIGNLAFNDLMSKELKPPNKPTNEHNPIFCETTTPEKPKQEFKVMEEDGDYALSLV